MQLRISYAKLLIIFLVLLIPEIALARKAKRQVVFENEADNQVRSSCRSPDGMRGVCVRITSCRSLMRTVKRNRLYRYFCGFEGEEPMVCCTDSKRTLNAGITDSPTKATTEMMITSRTSGVTRPITRPTRPTTRPPETVRPAICAELDPDFSGKEAVETTLRPVHPRVDEGAKPSFLPQGCGISNTSLYSRIVNGVPAQRGSWPWMAVIFIRKASGAISPECGGALVTRRHIVTAAHCMMDAKRNDIDPSRIFVRLGAHNLSVPNEPGAVDIGVDEVRNHERFESRTYKNDIAVLKLSRAVNFTEVIRPVCLPYDSLTEEDLTGRSVFVAGFGTTSFNGKESDVLLEASVKVQSQEICKKAYENDKPPLKITSVYMCAGKMDGSKDACQGDSGGPLLAVGKELRFYLVGIVSFGKKCALPGYPGVYARVTEFLDWLREKLSD